MSRVPRAVAGSADDAQPAGRHRRPAGGPEAIQFLVMATAKLTRTSIAIRRVNEADRCPDGRGRGRCAEVGSESDSANPGATPAPGGTGTSAPGGAKPADKGGQPAQRLVLQRAAMQRLAAERRPERSAERESNARRCMASASDRHQAHPPTANRGRGRNFEAPAEARSVLDQPVQRRSAASYGGNLFVQRDPPARSLRPSTPRAPSDRQGDFKTAWGILNSLNMADMLATMERFASTATSAS